VRRQFMSYRTQYPPIEPFDTGYLTVGEGHEVYYEQSGNREGRPALFVHGGPGGGGDVNARRFFDPKRYRIVVFDQRGSGRSRPHASLEANTTWHLVADMERLRNHLRIPRWLVFGGSWGSTLALAYAIAHPERCSGLVLRGIFLCRSSEIEWFLYGVRNLFPEAWAAFASAIPAAERGDLLSAYYRRLTDFDPAIHMPAARAWSIYEGSCSTLLASPETVAYFSSDVVALGLARIEAHYFTHQIFMPPNALLENVGRIRQIPAVMVQGRYDAVCPIVTADDLHRAWPEADYVVVPDAGHSAWEPGICAELVKATERFKRQ
jgi:proline iminopeptidase